MKKLTLLSLFLLVGTLAIAQGRFSIGANLALPQGDFGDFVGTGFGASVGYESPINDNLTWNGSVGYLSFGEKDDSGVKASIIPILGGVNYYFQGEAMTGFYGGATLGLYAAKSKFEGEELVGFDQNGDPIFETVSESQSESEFGFGLKGGYHLPTFDIQLTYNIVNDADFIGIRVAYVLGGN